MNPRIADQKCHTCREPATRWELDGYGNCRACAADTVAANRATSGLTSDFGPEADAAIDAAIATFPATFGLRNHPGLFRISRRASYVSGGRIVLYTEVLHTDTTPRMGRTSEWLAFAKGTIAELRAQIVSV